MWNLYLLNIKCVCMHTQVHVWVCMYMNAYVYGGWKLRCYPQECNPPPLRVSLA